MMTRSCCSISHRTGSRMARRSNWPKGHHFQIRSPWLPRGAVDLRSRRRGGRVGDAYSQITVGQPLYAQLQDSLIGSPLGGVLVRWTSTVKPSRPPRSGTHSESSERIVGEAVGLYGSDVVVSTS